MKSIVYIINVDWYFKLHWAERALHAKKNGFSVTIITTITDENIFKYLDKLGFTVINLNLYRKSLNPLKELIYVFSLYKNILKIKPTIIHAVTIKPNVYAGLINRFFLNLPIVYSITGLGAIFSNSKYKLIKKIIESTYRIISTKNSTFIFENYDDLKYFKSQQIIKDNGIVIEGAGVDIDRYCPIKEPQPNSILFAARLLEDKGLDTLIESVKKLKLDNINCTLNVAGIIDNDVNGAIPINEITKLNDNGDINWLGTCDNMVNVINSNSVVCLPTRYGEGVPRILIEAASCARPIIATNVSGCKEIIKDGINGYLISVNDSTSLAKHLRYLFDNKNISKNMGIEGRNIVKAVYNKNIVLKETLKIYNTLGDRINGK
ncbi:glycosyltransferase family 4 protein [Photobacterium damselae]|nr:glycosyltransferase family 4 protein [Photobacterium damselae]